MSIMRKVVNAGEKIADFFAYDLQNKYYKFLFNRELSSFEGINDALSKEYKKEIKNFWGKRYKTKVDFRWFAHYKHCYGVESVYYIPDNIFHSIIEPYFNKDAYVKCMSNKNYFENWLPELKHVNTLARNIKGVWYDKEFNKISVDDLLKVLQDYSEFVVKPSVDSAGGAGVEFVSNINSKDQIMNLIKNFKSDFLIQESFKQHKLMNDIYDSSVNTVRIMTLNLDGEIYVLSSLLRMGVNGKRVDNMVSGGVNCAIRDDGSLVNKLYNAVGKRFDGHPNTGSLEGKVVPNFAAVVDAAKSSHKRLPYMGIISWDFAINEEAQPVLIEFNLKPQGLDLHQRENGPLFKDLTEKILDKIFI